MLRGVVHRRPILLALLLLIAAATYCTGAQAATVFADDFEAGITGWTEAWSPDLVTSPAIGTYAVQLTRRESIQRVIPTTGYDHIVVSFYAGTNSLWWTKSHLDVSWFDGTKWVLLKRIAYGDPETDSNLHYFQYALPDAASNFDNFAIRVAMTSRSNGRDKGFFDDLKITAEARTYSVTINKTGEGEVYLNGSPTPLTLPYTETFVYGTELHLAATPDTGYRFGVWSGDLATMDNPVTLVVDAEKHILANFLTTEKVLIVNGIGGTVNVNDVPHALPWAEVFAADAEVKLEAVAGEGHSWSNWSGDATGTDNPIYVTMDADKNITANFNVFSYTLSIAAADHGSVLVDGVPVTLPYSGTYEYGTVLQIEGVPDDGYHFMNWSGDLTGSTNPVFLPIKGDTSIAAHFGLDDYLLSVTGNNGSITVNGVAQNLPYSAYFSSGETVSLGAVPAEGYRFGAWTGDLAGSANPIVFSVEGDMNVVANFLTNQYVLNLTGTPGGSVSVDGVTHALPWSGIYDPGASVTLVPVPDSGYIFSGWSGDLNGSANPAEVTINHDTNIQASFAVEVFTLNVAGMAGGSITVDGVAHALPWSGTYAPGTVVSLAAVPDANYTFTGWAGDLTGTTNPASITMTGDLNITVQFAPIQYLLVLSGTGGTVTVNGVSHGLPWSGTFAAGAVVTLVPVPASGYVFTGWSGDLTGTANPAQVTMSQNRNVSAQFALAKYALTVSANAGGTVKVNGEAVALPASIQFDGGTEVTVEARGDATHIFRGWSGAVVNRQNQITVKMDAAKNLVATFATIEIFVDVSADSWGAKEIAACYYEGIIQGYPGNVYLPSIPVTRDQMAVYIARAAAGGDANVPDGPSTPSFPDVPSGYWAYKYIEYVEAHGIVQGFPDGTYGPTLVVTRDQMAVYIARAVANPMGEAGLATYVPTGDPSFVDVQTTFWAYKYIEYCKALGIVRGYADGYHPEDPVTRDQMAVYIARAFALPM